MKKKLGENSPGNNDVEEKEKVDEKEKSEDDFE